MTGLQPGPAKILLERRVQRGDKENFEAWVADVIASAGRSGSVEGSSVLSAGGDEYFILLRFASRDDLERWQTSPDVERLLARGDTLSTGVAALPVIRSGLETWFTVPGRPTPARPPPRWKMALLTWSALLPQVILLSFVIPKDLPFPVGIALSTAIPVVMLTWVVMPRLTKLLFTWLYGATGEPQARR
jgi:uncharacterized protein